jgi:hydroxyacylglutathione hydrolase
MNVQGLVLGELDTNAWLVDDGAGGPLIVIDPAGDAAELLAAIDGKPVAAVVLTHGHFDHLGAAEAVVHLTHAPLMVHEADADAITTAIGTGAAMFGYKHAAPEADRRLVDGDAIEAGGVTLTVIHTPGHTPGSISLHAPEAGELFSGDTLFAGSIGRTDFPGGDSTAILRSLAKLAVLPGDTKVHPGHGPDTTIVREERVNPFWPRA